jgi:cytochrome c peroxidase
MQKFLAVLMLVAACDRSSTTPASGTASGSAEAEAPTGPKATEMQLQFDLGKPKIPEDNPQTDDKVKLGHQLFFDKRLSSDGSRACYSCHLNEDGNGGHDGVAIGAGNKKLSRHSPVIWNVAFLSELSWDGRSNSLEAQAKAAWAGDHMGVGEDKLEDKAKEIAKIPGYKRDFEKVFGKEGVTPGTIVKALAAFERSLICDNSKYDRFAKGDKSVLDESQKRGLELFVGKAACSMCHAPPHFSVAYGGAQGVYFNVGIGTTKENEEIDIGRMKVSNAPTDWAAFKIPTLRNAVRSRPYFHDGSIATLDEAVKIMSTGGIPNKNKSTLLMDRKLSEDEHRAVIAFVGALDCENRLDEPVLP